MSLCTCYYLPHAVNCKQRLVDAATPPAPRFTYEVGTRESPRGKRYVAVRIDRRTNRRWNLPGLYINPYVAYAVVAHLNRYVEEEVP